MGGCKRTIVGGLLLLVVRSATGAAGRMPVLITLPPLGRRCIHEEVPAGTEAVVDLFVASGGKLEVHLTVEGPLTKGWGNVPEPNEKTVKIFDSVVTNVRPVEEGEEAEDFEDSYLYTFTSDGGESGNVYQACVANDMNHLLSKTVQLDIRTKGHTYFPVKRATPALIPNPDEGGAPLTEEEKAAARDKEEEVANLEGSIRRLKAGLRKLQGQQLAERHRQAGHVAVSKDANDHMVGGSVVETLVFLAAAAFQLLFIRKWFDGKVGKKGRQWA